jgi:nucleoside triphosphate diphosphatase
MAPPDHGGEIGRLLDIMRSLRDPARGCPWDLQQDFASVAPYTIEEAYEVADAIGRNDMADLRDELGDLLLQVVFHARMAEEAGHFDFGDVVAAISEKMTRRHPHVFGDATVDDAEAQTRAWEAHKRAERAARGDDDSALAGIPRGLPEWQRALKLQKRAATVGFDWPSITPVIDKLHEEIDEVRAELAALGGDEPEEMVRARLQDEIGDLLFVVANVARHAKVESGQCAAPGQREVRAQVPTHGSASHC